MTPNESPGSSTQTTLLRPTGPYALPRQKPRGGWLPFILAAMVALLAGLVVWLTSGCASLGADTPAIIAALAGEAAFTGCRLDVAKHPERRPAYAAAVAALQSMVARDAYDPAEFEAALAALPLDGLNGEQGAILLGGVVTLWSVATGFVDVDKVPAVKVACKGILSGFQRALAAKGLPPVVKQVQPPPRK
jgi:hypothetical protein